MLKFARSVYFSLAGAVASPLVDRPARLYAWGDFLGRVRYRWGYVGGKRSRRTYLEHMQRALPALAAADVSRVLLAFWQNHQKSFLELFLLPRLTPANVGDVVDFEGLTILDQALARGRGAVLAAPHFGNERLLHVALALRGYPVTVMTSAFEDAPANLRRARLEPARRVHELVFPHDNPRRLYEALARNRAVQFSPTAAGGASGVWCRCFGHELFVNTTPARLALRTGAPLLPTFIYRLPDNRHRVVVEPPLTPPGGRVRDAAARLTQELMRVIEDRVAADPAQFYWMWLIIRAQEAEAAGRGQAGPAPGRPAGEN